MAGTELFTIYSVCQELMPGLPHGENLGLNPTPPLVVSNILCIIGIMYVYFC